MSDPTLKPLDIPGLLMKFDLHPSKGLGQNFLQDEKALRTIVEAAGLGSGDSVLEIGPGLGSLTRHLAGAARSVTAVELDRKLMPVLETVLRKWDNVHLVQGDILAMDPGKLMEGSEYSVVANIPYNITSALVRHLLGCSLPPRTIVLTVQKEVAERICILDGKMNLLAISVQVYGQAEIISIIPAWAFIPPPGVDSAVLRISVHAQSRIDRDNLDLFFQVARAGFSQKRKMLRNTLAAGMSLPHADAESRLNAAGIDPRRRAETLSLEEWDRLVKQFIL